MLTTVPSSMAIPEPRITVKSVSRPRAERLASSWSSCSSVGSSLASGGTAYLLAQLLGRVGHRPLRGQPVVDLLAFGVAHQADDVPRLRELQQRLERLQ